MRDSEAGMSLRWRARASQCLRGSAASSVIDVFSSARARQASGPVGKVGSVFCRVVSCVARCVVVYRFVS